MDKRSDKEFFSGAGIPIKALYTPDDTKDIDYNRDIGVAGEPPFRRGVYPEMYRRRLWAIRRYTGGGGPEETNELYHREYELGQTGFSVAIDAPTGAGIDSDDPRVVGDVGNCGVPIDTLLDMEIMLKDLPIDRVPMAMISLSMSTCPLMAMLFTVAEKNGMNLKELRGTTQNDILTTMAQWWLDQIAPRYYRRLAVDFIEWCYEAVPRWNPVSFDSYNARENGINAVQELGMLLADAVDYIEEELGRPHPMRLEDFVARFTFDMGIHNDFFEEIAKFRAARVMWHKILHDRYNVNSTESLKFRFHAQSSGCTHTAQEPYNNLIRIAYQMLAGVLGGAQSLHANGYDEGLCIPTEESMLLSIRTEQILQRETNVINTVDPLGGSYFVEALTGEMEKRTWEYIKRIEDLGGYTQAVEKGWIHREYLQAMVDHEKAVNEGKEVVVGVNWGRFEKEPYRVPETRPFPGITERQVAKIRKVKSERDNSQVKRALKELREATLSNENIMPPVMKAVQAYATLGEVCNVWRDLYGIWKYPMYI